MPITKIDKKKDGLQGYRVRVNYTDAHGISRRKEKIVYGLPEAKEAERKLAMQINEPTARMTVADLCALCLDTKMRETRESTYEKLAGKARTHILPYIGDCQLSRLTPQILQKWKNAISDKPLALSTKRDQYKALSTILNFGVRLGYIKENPLRHVGNFRDVNLESKPPERIRYYTPDQFIKYIKAAEENTSREQNGLAVFFAIAYYTGMRKGEINALKWSDINGNTIKVRRSVNLKARSGAVETPVKGSASIRDIQMPLPLIKILEKHNRIHRVTLRYSPALRVCGGYKCIPDTTLDKANRRFSAAADLPRITIHEFRHSHASLLCNEGINIQEIARRLGHADVQITWKTYAHLYPREEERALQVLNKIGVDI